MRRILVIDPGIAAGEPTLDQLLDDHEEAIRLLAKDQPGIGLTSRLDARDAIVEAFAALTGRCRVLETASLAAVAFCAELQEDADGVPQAELKTLQEALDAVDRSAPVEPQAFDSLATEDAEHESVIDRVVRAGKGEIHLALSENGNVFILCAREWALGDTVDEAARNLIETPKAWPVEEAHVTSSHGDGRVGS
jgi:hypothetical protein